jgi:hypothetical protein
MDFFFHMLKYRGYCAQMRILVVTVLLSFLFVADVSEAGCIMPGLPIGKCHSSRVERPLTADPELPYPISLYEDGNGKSLTFLYDSRDREIILSVSDGIGQFYAPVLSKINEKGNHGSLTETEPRVLNLKLFNWDNDSAVGFEGTFRWKEGRVIHPPKSKFN